MQLKVRYLPQSPFSPIHRRVIILSLCIQTKGLKRLLQGYAYRFAISSTGWWRENCVHKYDVSKACQLLTGKSMRRLVSLSVVNKGIHGHESCMIIMNQHNWWAIWGLPWVWPTGGLASFGPLYLGQKLQKNVVPVE